MLTATPRKLLLNKVVVLLLLKFRNVASVLILHYYSKMVRVAIPEINLWDRFTKRGPRT